MTRHSSGTASFLWHLSLWLLVTVQVQVSILLQVREVAGSLSGRGASWERDRLGHLAMDPALNGLPTVISCPINLQGKEVKVSLNVDGVSADTTAKVEMLTEQFKPIPGYRARCIGHRGKPQADGPVVLPRWARFLHRGI